MKKCFISAMLCLAFLISMASSVMAAPAYVTDPAKIKSYHGYLTYKYDGERFLNSYDAFTENWKKQHPNILEEKFAGKNVYGRFLGGFSEGLIAVGLCDRPGGDAWSYVFMNTDGDVIDFGRNKYYNGENVDSNYPAIFKEGTAFTYKETAPIHMSFNGYYDQVVINTSGDVVLNLFGYLGRFQASFPYEYGDYYINLRSRFVNGYTLVSDGAVVDVSNGEINQVWARKTLTLELMREGDRYGEPLDPNNLPLGVEDVYRVINTKGEIVETIHGAKALMAHPLTRVALMDDYGMTYGEYYDLIVNRKVTNGTDSENPLVEAPLQPTYGQASVKARGYTIENNVGYLLIDVTNKGKAKDQGDLFYVLYNKFKKVEVMVSNTTDFLPSDYIMQLHYEVGANETKTLRLPVSTVLGYDLTEGDIDGGWRESERISESRFVLAQAESETECAELVSFFKAAHDYGETSLDYIPDNGITVLAMPYSSTQRLNYLNQKLSFFTSQF